VARAVEDLVVEEGAADGGEIAQETVPEEEVPRGSFTSFVTKGFAATNFRFTVYRFLTRATKNINHGPKNTCFEVQSIT
jgi:hypothetical protein